MINFNKKLIDFIASKDDIIKDSQDIKEFIADFTNEDNLSLSYFDNHIVLSGFKKPLIKKAVKSNFFSSRYNDSKSSAAILRGSNIIFIHNKSDISLAVYVDNKDLRCDYKKTELMFVGVIAEEIKTKRNERMAKYPDQGITRPPEFAYKDSGSWIYLSSREAKKLEDKAWKDYESRIKKEGLEGDCSEVKKAEPIDFQPAQM